MGKIQDLSSSLERTIKDSDLQGITEDISDVLIDSIMKEGFLKELPIISLLNRLIKTSLNINERLLMKKIIHFLANIRDVDSNKRLKMISSINNSEKYKIRIGEKLLYILNNSSDHIASGYIGTLFSSFLEGRIAYSVFLRGTDIIQNLFIEDFEEFIRTEQMLLLSDSGGISDFHYTLSNKGLLIIEREEISISDQWDNKSSDKYIVEGGEQTISFTDIGKILHGIYHE